jgi:threonyl-tRNA synthetase
VDLAPLIEGAPSRSSPCATPPTPTAHVSATPPRIAAEAVRRLYPGVKVAIGPPIENGFYYDFDFPEPITEADLQKIEDEGGAS